MTSSILRNQYFSRKGVPSVPHDSDERLALAKSYLQRTKSDYDAIVMLFDPVEDENHIGWLQMMKDFYSWKQDNPYYNLDFSELLSDKLQKTNPDFAQYLLDKDLSELMGEVEQLQNTLIQELRKRASDIKTRTDALEYLGVSMDEGYEDWLEVVEYFSSIEPYDPTYCILLFDPNLHRQDSKSLLGLWGFFLDSKEKLRFSDPKTAERFLIHAARLGNDDAKLRLGISYIRAPQNVYRHEEGLELVRHSATSDEDIKRFILINSMIADTRYQNPFFPDFNKSLDDIFEEIECKDDKSPTDYFLLAFRTPEKQNIDYQRKINDCFETIMVLDGEGGEKYNWAAHSAGVRKIIGLGTKQCIEEGFHLLSICAHDGCPFKELADQAIRIIDKNPRAIYYIEMASNALRRFFYGETESDLVKHELIKYTQNGHASEILMLAQLLSMMTNREKWVNSYIYCALYEELVIGAGHFKEDKLENSMISMGPRYNPTSPNGFPVAYVYENSSQEISASFNTASYVPSPGIVSIKGVLGFDDGSFKFDLEGDSSRPAYLVEEDFRVCLALVFGSDKPISPGLSVERHIIYSCPSGYQPSISCKEWDPEWLGHTDFGKTQFYADILTGEICWNSKEMYTLEPFADNLMIVQQNSSSSPSTFFNELARMQSSNPDLGTARVMIRPEKMKFDPQRIQAKNGSSFWSINLIEAKMRVDGSYMKNPKDKAAKRDIAENDPNYLQGKRCQYMTDNYDEMCAAFPIFERSRQMMVLYHSLLELSKVWRPSTELKKEFSLYLQYFQGLPPIPKADLLIKRRII